MKRLCVFIIMFLLSVFCFAQQIVGIKVIGRIPDATDNRLYQLQVGSFRLLPNASNAFNKLRSASLNASYEKYGDLTRVLIKGVSAWAVRPCIELIKRAGFSEVFIKLDLDNGTTAAPPSAGQQPSTGRQSSASSQESQSIWTQDDEYEDDFPKVGVWKLTGHDPAGTEWKADIVISNVRNNTFTGYFDWYMEPDSDYRGKEHFTGQFDNISDKVFFQGTRLENSKNLVLGKYEAYVSINREQFYNGRWDEPDGIPVSDWQATLDE